MFISTYTILYSEEKINVTAFNIKTGYLSNLIKGYTMSNPRKRPKTISAKEKQRRATQSKKQTTPINPVQVIETGEVANVAWDQLRSVYRECSALSTLPIQVTPLLENEEALSVVKDRDLLAADCQALAKLVRSFNESLAEIYARHSDKHGAVDDPDILIETLIIGESYQGWMEQYQLSIIPSIGTVLSHFGRSTVDLDNTPLNV